MQIWGVRGMNSENGKFYYDNNGKLVDGRTQQATYDALITYMNYIMKVYSLKSIIRVIIMILHQIHIVSNY